VNENQVKTPKSQTAPSTGVSSKMCHHSFVCRSRPHISKRLGSYHLAVLLLRCVGIRQQTRERSMLYALMWAMVGLLFFFWTAAAWGLHLAAQWFAGLEPATLEAATTAAGDAARQAVPLLGLPEWLTAGLPAGVVEAWLAWAQSFLPGLEWLQQQAPALFGWLSPVIWVGWGFGALLLLLGGVALHVVIRLIEGRRTPPMTPAQPWRVRRDG
jgi:hypothetical protein